MLKKFTDDVPHRLYLDPSVFINAILTTAKYHKECSRILKKIRDRNCGRR